MPRILLLGGPMGSGKSTTAKHLHKLQPGAALIGFDIIKRQISNYSSTPEQNAAVGQVVLATCKEYLEHGVSVIVDQGFMNEEYIAPYKELAKKYDAEMCIIQLEAPKETLLSRIRQREEKQEPFQKISQQKKEQNIKTYYEHKTNAPTYNTTNKTPKETAKEILADIKKTRTS